MSDCRIVISYYQRFFQITSIPDDINFSQTIYRSTKSLFSFDLKPTIGYIAPKIQRPRCLNQDVR